MTFSGHWERCENGAMSCGGLVKVFAPFAIKKRRRERERGGGFFVFETSLGEN